jgi:glycosyltransferase involved in cell wall biosynthesis
MKILIITQYFWPERFNLNELVKEIALQGNHITVLTGKPNYPEGKIYPGYKEQGIEEEIFNPNVKIIRVPLRPRKNGGGKNLFLNYLSFVYNGCKYFTKYVKNKNFDIIFAIGYSPITSIIPAIVIKKILNKHLVIWIQDLWPESLKATGYITNKTILQLVNIMVKLIYFFSDTILVQSYAFKNHLQKITDTKKLIYYPNSYSIPVTVETKLDIRPDLIRLFEEKFCLVFAGNLGKAQALDTIVESAKKLYYLNDLKIIFLGDGIMKSHLKNRISKENIHNIILAGSYPSDMIQEFYKRAQGLIVTLVNDPILSLTIPSKIQSYLAASKPIIGSLSGEGADIIIKANAGIVCSPENPDELAKNITKFYELSEKTRQKMGEAGYSYYKENFEMKKQTQNLINIFKNRLQKNA